MFPLQTTPYALSSWDSRLWTESVDRGHRTRCQLARRPVGTRPTKGPAERAKSIFDHHTTLKWLCSLANPPRWFSKDRGAAWAFSTHIHSTQKGTSGQSLVLLGTACGRVVHRRAWSPIPAEGFHDIGGHHLGAPLPPPRVWRKRGGRELTYSYRVGETNSRSPQLKLAAPACY